MNEALRAAPKATTIYLALKLPILASEQGFDLIGAFHARGRILYCFTLVGDEQDAQSTLRQIAPLGPDQITTDDTEGLLRLWASDT